MTLTKMDTKSNLCTGLG